MHQLKVLFISVVKEINRINERELELGGTASWHDEYKGIIGLS